MKILSRIFYSVLISLALLVPATAIIFAAADHSEFAKTISLYVVGATRRVVLYPSTAQARYASCSLGDVWTGLQFPTDDYFERELESQTEPAQVDGSLALFRTPVGDYWIPERDRPTLFEMLHEQSRDVYSSDLAMVEPGDIVLDCGANAGVYTRTALRRGGRLVVAIDPAPQAIECLRRNLKDEIASGRVIIYGKGVWNEEATLELSQSANLASTASSVVIDRGLAGPVVQLTTIDKLVDELNLERVDFIKMDIEGAERQALQGAAKTIAEFHPKLAIALEHYPTDPDTIPALIDELYAGYRRELSECVNVNGSIQPDVVFLQSQ